MPVQLSAEQVQRSTEAIEALVEVSQEAVVQVKQTKTELIAKLQAQQIRLMRLHAEEGDGVSPDAFRAERGRMQAEIAAAAQSLAETEQRLQLDADMLCTALELAEDVAAVYMSSSEQIKRGYNQALFNKLYITLQWDDDHEQIAVRVSRAELTKPYALLLDKHLPNKVLNQVELIRQASTTAGSGPNEPLPDAGCSIFVKLAEGEGFEPSSDQSGLKRFSRSAQFGSTEPKSDCSRQFSRQFPANAG